MNIDVLNDKKRYDNRFGKGAYISSYVYYDGTEQVSIYVKTGFGASEKTHNEIISEHDIDKWVSEFKANAKEVQQQKPITPQMETEETFSSMRKILFDSMRKVNEGSMDLKKAQAISLLGQTIINSAKTENEFLKITGGKHKPTIYEGSQK